MGTQGDQAVKLKTNVSGAFRCELESEEPYFEFKEARWTMPDNPERSWSIFWLDHLFEGGILLPRSSDPASRAATLLLTGPPGSGKSVLAMEMCYHWSLSSQ